VRPGFALGAGSVTRRARPGSRQALACRELASWAERPGAERAPRSPGRTPGSRKCPLVFHALAHPARRAIIRQLADGERNLSELAAPLKMTFPAATKHVRMLEGARLVRRRVAGRAQATCIERG
jgi:hypothetical protein